LIRKGFPAQWQTTADHSISRHLPYFGIQWRESPARRINQINQINQSPLFLGDGGGYRPNFAGRSSLRSLSDNNVREMELLGDRPFHGGANVVALQ
jgi:hypothetical protein